MEQLDDQQIRHKLAQVVEVEFGILVEEDIRELAGISVREECGEMYGIFRLSIC